MKKLLALIVAALMMFSAVACMALSAIDICPGWMVRAVDTLACALQDCLSIIAALN